MWFFGKPRTPTSLVIECSASRVAGAYTLYPQGTGAVLCYSAEVPLQLRSNESIDATLLRALDQLGTRLIEEGAPELRRHTGNGRPDSILVSMGAPWQQSAIRVHRTAPGKEFIVTKSMLAHLLGAEEQPPQGFRSLPATLIATYLNGYRTPEPIGKKARRAEVTVLSTIISESIEKEIRARLRRLYHTHDITICSFGAATYGALQHHFAHEPDFLVLHISSRSTELAFVKDSQLVDVAALPTGLDSLLRAVRSAERVTIEEEQGEAYTLTAPPEYVQPARNARFEKRADNARAEWIAELIPLFRRFAERSALPRTLFLLVEPAAQSFVRSALDADELHALWLSDNPLTILPLTQEQLTQSAQSRGQAHHDVFLALLAVYYGRRTFIIGT